MSGIFLRWGVPALLTVVGGTALAISATSGSMTEALAARAADVLATDDAGWATVSFESRDAILSGTVGDQAVADAAAAKLAAVHGIRSVRTDVTIAERVSPFPFVATVADGQITLSGGVPDGKLGEELAGHAGAARNELRLLAGAPPRDRWTAAVVYALGLLDHMDQGRVALADLDLTVSGRARSSTDFDALTQLSSQMPDGITLATAEITPPPVSPYTWSASFDGDNLRVSGFAPSEAFVRSLQEDGIAGHAVSTSLRLASGAPPDFEISARTLLHNLVLLEDGTAEISDTTITLSGAPPDSETAERVRAAMTRIGARFDLAPPRLEVFTFVAERRGDSIVLSGSVPDSALRDRLDATEGVDASALELARGAPDRFESGVDFGLELLSHLSEGRFGIEGTSLSIAGRAATVADFDEVETALSLGAPQGLILAHADVRPPLAEPFTWSAIKGKDGVTLAGFVPSKAARARLATAAIDVAADTTIVADGAPEDFESEAGLALGLLQLLQTGEIKYDGANWAMLGTVATPVDAVTADQAFARSGLREAGWSFDVDAPAAPEPVRPPVADPYTWTATKAATGIISLAGHVPTEGLQRILVARAGAGAVDELSLATGQPDGFINGALTGIDALVKLDAGTLSFDGAHWSLTGQVATVDQRLAVEESLNSAVDASGWHIAIQALDAPPVASPYTWSATKTADGRIALAGYVSTDELKRFIAVRAGEGAVDSTEVASGEPAGFIADVLAGLEALSHLNEGAVTLGEGGWTLSGTPATAADADLAVAAVGEAAGGGRWTTQLSEPAVTSTPQAAPESAAGSTPEEPAVEHDFAFSATKPPDAALVLAGAVPTRGAGDYLGLIAGAAAVDDLSVTDSLPDDFIINAVAGLRMLPGLVSGAFGLEGDKWVLEGTAETEADRAAILQRIAATPPAAAWQTRIALMPPIEACRRKVAAFAGRNAILFQSGSARLADESNAAIDELAGYLEICPDAVVHVEGHTDSDGADDLNLALSVARAEMVVEALIERGVAFQRLYAIGYGESLPIADNDTAAGKRANRRIGFTIEDEQQ